MVSFLKQTEIREVRCRVTDRQTNMQTDRQTDPTTVPSLRMRGAEGNKKTRFVVCQGVLL